MRTHGQRMLPCCLRIRTNRYSAFSGSRSLSQVCIVFCANFFTDAKANCQRSSSGCFRILADSYRNGIVRIIGLCILAQGNGIGRRSCATQTSYRVVAGCRAAFTEGQRVFAAGYRIFAKSRSVHVDGFGAFAKGSSIIIIDKIVAAGRGRCSCYECYIFRNICRSRSNNRAVRLFGQGDSMDIPMIVLNVVVAVRSFNDHIIMDFSGRLTILHIPEVLNRIGIAIGVCIGFVAVRIDFRTAGQPHGAAGIGLHAGQGIRAKSRCKIAGCYGTVAKGRAVLSHGPGPAAEGRGTIGACLGIGAKGYSIGIFSQGPFPKGQRTPTQGFGPVAKSNGILTIILSVIIDLL